MWSLRQCDAIVYLLLDFTKEDKIGIKFYKKTSTVVPKSFQKDIHKSTGRIQDSNFKKINEKKSIKNQKDAAVSVLRWQ